MNNEPSPGLKKAVEVVSYAVVFAAAALFFLGAYAVASLVFG